MKKYILVFSLVLSLAPFLTMAQTGTSTPNLPNITITPDSPFYFIVGWSEGIREFFTFSAEAKARLQIEFAAKRIAEIKDLLEKKGVNAKGLDVAESKLKDNLSRAGDAIDRLKSQGKDVSELANDLSDDFQSSKEVLNQSIENQKNNLEEKKKSIEAELEKVKESNDTEKKDSLEQDINNVEDQQNSLDDKKSDIEDTVGPEEDRISESAKSDLERANESKENSKEENSNQKNSETPENQNSR